MARNKPPTDRSLILKNKRATHKYVLLEKLEAGIVLVGCEVKSLRDKLVNFADAYCRVKDGEVWLHGLHIKPYPNAGYYSPDPDRRRKLLLHRREIRKLARKAVQSGLTIVPTRLYFNGPRVKVEIALARGKKTHDKRQELKARDMDRDISRRRS